MKQIVVLFMLNLMISLLPASQVLNQIQAVQQPHGGSLNLLLSGDEFDNHFHDNDGFTIIQDKSSGFYVYAGLKAGHLVPTELLPGKDDPRSLGLKPHLLDSDMELDKQQSKKSRDMYVSPSIGTLNSLVIFIRFSDQGAFSADLNFYESRFNSTSSASVKSYLGEISGTQLSVTSTFKPNSSGTTLVPYVDSHPLGYYLPHSGSNSQGYSDNNEGSLRMQILMYNALQFVKASISPSLDLDFDNDGYLDMVTMFIKGSKVQGTFLWPRVDYYGYNAISVNSAQLSQYATELEADSDLGTICHESLHFFGFPDLYRSGDYYAYPAGEWDVMDFSGSVPTHPLAYTKWKYGHWFSTLPTTSGEGKYTLEAISQNPFSCIKIASPNSSTEYIVAEYRRQSGLFESGLPGQGIIFYLINTLAGDGNYDGPPNEVWVYRPLNVVPDYLGQFIDSAIFCLQENSQSFQQYSNPQPLLSNSAIFGRYFFGIGNSGTASMSFILMNSQPHIWDVSAAQDWSNPLSWKQGTVPGATTDVYLRYSGILSMNISSGNAYCRNLLIDQESRVELNSRMLTVNGNMRCLGMMEFLGTSTLKIYGDLIWDDHSNIFSESPDMQVLCYEDLTWESGSAANMPIGKVSFLGTSNSVITQNGLDGGFFNLEINKSATASVTIASSAASFIRVNGMIRNLGGSFYNFFTGDFVVKQGVYSYPGANLKWHYGTLNMSNNSGPSYISLSEPTDYIHNLIINCSGNNTLYLETNLNVENDIIRDWGTLVSNGHTISLGGDWDMGSVTDYFDETGSRVVFMGETTQHILYSENFNILELNKPTGALTIDPGASVTCNLYDWTAGNITVNGGSLITLDMADAALKGNFSLVSGSVSLTKNGTGPLDLAGNLSIAAGTMDFHGSSGDTYWPYGGNGSLTMSGGSLTIHDVGLQVNSVGTFTENITGGEIHLKKSFSCSRADFTPSGGTIFMEGSSDANLSLSFGSLYSLVIDKASRSDLATGNMQTRSSTLSLGSNITMPVNFQLLSGTLKLNGRTLTVPALFNVYGTLMMANSADRLLLGNGITFRNGSSAVITDGDIECTGPWKVLSGANVVIPPASSLTMKTANLIETFELSGTNTQFGDLILDTQATLTTFTILSTSTQPLKVSGNLTINTTNTLDIDNGNLTVGGNLSLGGTLNVHDRSVQITGKPVFFTTGTLSIDSGSFIWQDNIAPRSTTLLGSIALGNGILQGVNHSVTAGIGLNFTVGTGTIRCTGFSAVLTGVFVPTTGILEITSNPLGQPGQISLGHGNTLANLLINSSTGASLASDAVVNPGSVTIQSGRLDLAGHTLTTYNGLVVQNTGILKIDAGAILQLTTGKTLNVQSGGTLEALGTGAANAQITTLSGSMTYSFQSGSNISAEYCIFSKMNTNGVQVLNGAIVHRDHCFTGCTFKNGVIGGALLNLANTQSLVIDGAIFPTIVIGGVNVLKSVNRGEVFMSRATGSFAGEEHEGDTYDLITWGVLPAVDDLSISLQGNGQVHLDWSYAQTPTSFKVYGGDIPEFSLSSGNLLVTLPGTTTEWNFTPSTAMKFFTVVAVQ